MPFNAHFVSVCGGGKGIVILRPPQPHTPISKQAALEFAAWIVALAEEKAGEFEDILNEVKNS